MDLSTRPGLSRDAKSGAKALAMNSEESELMRGNKWRGGDYRSSAGLRAVGRRQSLQTEPLTYGARRLPPSGAAGPEVTPVTKAEISGSWLEGWLS